MDMGLGQGRMPRLETLWSRGGLGGELEEDPEKELRPRTIRCRLDAWPHDGVMPVSGGDGGN